MADYFALLDEPRRPWLDPEGLKQKFLALSATAHPDRLPCASAEERDAANQRYAEINAAYQCLRDPKDRLLHLLETELGTKLKHLERMPSTGAHLGFQVGQMCQAVDAFLREKSKVTAPMLKAQHFGKALEWVEKLNELNRVIQFDREQALEELKALNAAWEKAPPVGSVERRVTLPLERLEQIYRTVSYLSRWSGQLSARMVQLSL